MIEQVLRRVHLTSSKYHRACVPFGALFHSNVTPHPHDSPSQTHKLKTFPMPSFVRRQFGGFAAESEYRAEALRLTRTLGETAPFQRKQYFCCSYDPPLKPYGRRNEVWFLQEEP